MNKTADAKPTDQGFSLIEVLVVVVIMGALAAIAIPVLTGQRQKAVEASVKSDLHNYAILQSAYGTEKGTFGTREQVDAWAEKVNLSPGNSLQVISGAGTDTGFCLRATDLTTTLTWFYDSTRGGLLPEGEYCGEPLPAPTDVEDDGCRGSGHGGPGNNYCPGSNGNGGNGGNGTGNGNGRR